MLKKKGGGLFFRISKQTKRKENSHSWGIMNIGLPNQQILEHTSQQSTVDQLITEKSQIDNLSKEKLHVFFWGGVVALFLIYNVKPDHSLQK